MDAGVWKIKERLDDVVFEYYHCPFIEGVVIWDSVWFFYVRWFYAVFRTGCLFFILLFDWLVDMTENIFSNYMGNYVCYALRTSSLIETDFCFLISGLMDGPIFFDLGWFLEIFAGCWPLVTNMLSISTKCNFVSLEMK